MKKIFTFILLAISTLAMAQAYPGDPGTLKAPAANPSYTDVITYTSVANTTPYTSGAYWAQNKTYTTATSYYLYLPQSSNNTIRLSVGYDIVTTTSVGRVNTISLDWNTNSKSNSQVIVYGKSNPYPKDGSEIDGSYNKGTKIATISNGTTSVAISGKYQYIMIEGNNDPELNSISIEWGTITTYNINTYVTSGNGTITYSPSSAEKGTTVNVTFAGATRPAQEVTSYTIDGITTNLTEDKISNTVKTSFTMPDHEVNISAVFSNVPVRESNTTIVSGPNVDVLAQTINLVSGDEMNFTMVSEHTTSKITTEVTGTTVARPSNVTNTSFTLKAYNQGTAYISFTTVQSNSYAATTTTYTINVVPREVILVSQATDGNYYAVGNAISEGMMQAVPVIKSGDNFITLNGDNSNLKWLVCTIYDAERTQYTIQSGTATSSTKNYLQFTDADLDFARFGNTAFTWYKQGEGFMTKKTEISWSSKDGKYTARTYSIEVEGAYEVDFSKLNAATQETLPRNLVQGQFNTVCMPYAFFCPNTDVHFYSIECMEEKDGKYNFNFEEENFTSTPSEAGIPYIVRAQDDNHNKNLPIYKVSGNVALGSKNGLIGMTTPTTISNIPNNTDSEGLLNIMVFYQGNLMFAKSGTVGANSAYIQFQDLPSCTGASSPKRVVLEVEKQESPEIATGVENLSADQINWNEPVYNIMGQRVARGTTGVLVQNGQKFIAH